MNGGSFKNKQHQTKLSHVQSILQLFHNIEEFMNTLKENIALFYAKYRVMKMYAVFCVIHRYFTLFRGTFLQCICCWMNGPNIKIKIRILKNSPRSDHTHFSVFLTLNLKNLFLHYNVKSFYVNCFSHSTVKQSLSYFPEIFLFLSHIHSKSRIM